MNPRLKLEFDHRRRVTSVLIPMWRKPTAARGKIFINYRREDAAGYARVLFDRLTARYPGRVFMDVSVIRPGADFIETIEKEIGACEACVVVIGKNWLTSTDAGGRRRLDDPGDFVRLEISAALRRNVHVIPVLVGGAAMPSDKDLPAELLGLTRRNALQITDQDLDHGVTRLLESLDALVGRARTPPRVWWVTAGALVCLLLVVSVVMRLMPHPPPKPPIRSDHATNVDQGNFKPGPLVPVIPIVGSKCPEPQGSGSTTAPELVGRWHLKEILASGPSPLIGLALDLSQASQFQGSVSGTPLAYCGRWEFDARRKVLQLNGTTPPPFNRTFSCSLKAQDDHLNTFSGDCADSQRTSWTWELSRP